MTRCLAGVLLLLLLSLPVMAVPAFATEGAAAGEEEGPPPAIDNIGTQNEVAQEYFPPEYDEPSVFPPIKYALVVLALLFGAAIALAYVRWLPRFAQERRTKRKAGSRR